MQVKSVSRRCVLSKGEIGKRKLAGRNWTMEFNYAEIIMLLLATIGPLKVTIVCATLTADASPEFLKRVAFRSVLIALIVCILFAVLGEAILRLFKVSVPAFQIGGGIIVLLFSLEMVMGGKQGEQGRRRQSRGEERRALARHRGLPAGDSAHGLGLGARRHRFPARAAR